MLAPTERSRSTVSRAGGSGAPGGDGGAAAESRAGPGDGIGAAAADSQGRRRCNISGCWRRRASCVRPKSAGCAPAPSRPTRSAWPSNGSTPGEPNGSNGSIGLGEYPANPGKRRRGRWLSRMRAKTDLSQPPAAATFRASSRPGARRCSRRGALPSMCSAGSARRPSPFRPRRSRCASAARSSSACARRRGRSTGSTGPLPKSCRLRGW